MTNDLVERLKMTALAIREVERDMPAYQGTASQVAEAAARITELEQSRDAARSNFLAMQGAASKLAAALRSVVTAHDECSGAEPSVSVLARSVDSARVVLGGAS